MKINFNKKSKKITIICLLTLLLSTPLITASSITYCQIMNLNQTSVFNDNLNYVINNADKKINKVETTNSKWSIKETDSMDLKYFNTPEEMQKYATGKYIKPINVKSSYNLSKHTDPLTGVLTNTKNGDDIWKYISLENNPEIQTIYKGVNGQIYNSELEAKRSFQQIYEAYYFNGIYFNTKEELQKYLYDEYFLNNKIESNAITIKAPNGRLSYPIKENDINFDNLVNSFVANNANVVIKYNKSIKKGNDQIVQGDSYYFTKENYKNNISEINPIDLRGQKIYSNENKAEYILDTSFEDEHTLYAPYFYKGTLDIGSFSNIDNWQKVEDKQELGSYKKGLINGTITSAFNLLLNENNTIIYSQISANQDKFRLFNMENLKVLSDSNVSWDNFYISEIKKYSTTLYNDIYNTYLNLLHGKRYNSFYKIPIMYTYIMQKIIDGALPQYLLDLTVEYFSSVCNYLQDTIDALIPNINILKNVNKKDNIFNLKDFFNIGNAHYNLSSSIEAYTEILKQNYPMLAIFLFTIVSAVNDSNSYLGVLNSYDYFISLLDTKYFIFGDNKYLFENLKNEFSKVYNIFSSLKKTKFMKNIESYCQLNLVIRSENFNKQKSLEVLFQSCQNYAIGTEESLIDDLNTYDGRDFKKSICSIREMTDYKSILQNTPINSFGYGSSYDNNLNNKYQHNPDPLVVYKWYFENQGKVIKEVAKESDLSIGQTYFLLVAGFQKDKGKSLTINEKTSFLEIIRQLNTLKQSMQDDLKKDYSNKNDEYQKINSKLYSFVSMSPEKFLENAFKNSSNNNDEIKRALEASKDMIGAASSIVWAVSNIFPLLKVCAVLQVGLQIVDFALTLVKAFMPEETKFYYIYTTLNNDKFVWDGGKEVTRFYGFIPVNETTSKDMKLLSPIQYVLPIAEEFFYYDQTKYFGANDLANIQMQSMFSQLNSPTPKLASKAFSYQYTFDLIPLDNSLSFNPINSSIKSFKTLDELKQYVLSEIKTSLTLNNLNSKYIGNKLFAFSNGSLATTIGAAKNNLINNIIANIRPTYLAIKPEVDTNGFATKFGVKSFILPNKSWTSNHGLYQNKIIDNSKYIIDDSANELKIDKLPIDNILNTNYYVETSQIQAADNAKAQLIETLNQQINIDQRSLLKSELLNSQDFNKLNDGIYSQCLYQVKLPNQIIEYFTDVASVKDECLKIFTCKKFIITKLVKHITLMELILIHLKN